MSWLTVFIMSWLGSHVWVWVTMVDLIFYWLVDVCECLLKGPSRTALCFYNSLRWSPQWAGPEETSVWREGLDLCSCVLFLSLTCNHIHPAFTSGLTEYPQIPVLRMSMIRGVTGRIMRRERWNSEVERKKGVENKEGKMICFVTSLSALFQCMTWIKSSADWRRMRSDFSCNEEEFTEWQVNMITTDNMFMEMTD